MMLLFGTGVVCGVALAGLYAVYQESPTLDRDTARKVATERLRDAAMTYCECVQRNFGTFTAWDNYLRAVEVFRAEWREDDNNERTSA